MFGGYQAVVGLQIPQYSGNRVTDSSLDLHTNQILAKQIIFICLHKNHKIIISDVGCQRQSDPSKQGIPCL